MEEISFIDLMLVFLASLALSLMAIKILPKVSNIGIDKNLGIQKIHTGKSLRIGGLIIILNLLFFLNIYGLFSSKLFLLFICILPLLFLSALEDFFMNISPSIRLVGALMSASLIVYFTNTKLSSVEINWANDLLKISFVSYFVTIIGITATANAWNFIDGLNGLSSGLGVVVLSVISYYAYSGNYLDVFNLSLFLAFSILGFFIVNLFTGKIFLGDTGSYILGIFIAWSGVKITSNQYDVSSWLIFFIIIYPATDLLYSIIRRLSESRSPFQADNNHLHSLIYLTLSKTFINNNKLLINSISGLIVLTFASIPSIIIIIYDINYPFVAYGVIIFFVIYFTLTIIFRNIISDFREKNFLNNQNEKS